MSKLTVQMLQDRVPDVTLYELEADREHYAFLGGPGLDLDRLHDLFLGCPEEGFDQYFESAWFPLAHGPDKLAAMVILEDKVRQVRCEDIDKYIAVLMHHSDSINDNFADALKPTLDEALVDVENMQKFFSE